MGASNKPADVVEGTATVDDTPTDAPARRVPKVGDMLLVTVEPGSNNGHDSAPILITSVHQVDGEERVNGLVFREHAALPQVLGDLQVFAHRGELDALDAHEDPKVRATRPGYAAHFHA